MRHWLRQLRDWFRPPVRTRIVSKVYCSTPCGVCGNSMMVRLDDGSMQCDDCGAAYTSMFDERRYHHE